MPIQYRKLVVTDAQPCVALRREMLLESPASFGSSPEDDLGSDLQRVRKRLSSTSEEATLGAFDPQDRLIGSVGVWCAGKPKRRHIASIWGMYVAPSHRRQGVGRQLMEAAIAFAKAQEGVAQVQLSVSASAPGAQRLYESLGFTVWGTEPDALRVDGQSFDEHHMALDLTHAARPSHAATHADAEESPTKRLVPVRLDKQLKAEATRPPPPEAPAM